MDGRKDNEKEGFVIEDNVGGGWSGKNEEM